MCWTTVVKQHLAKNMNSIWKISIREICDESREKQLNKTKDKIQKYKSKKDRRFSTWLQRRNSAAQQAQR